jgi:hypothetical protein
MQRLIRKFLKKNRILLKVYQKINWLKEIPPQDYLNIKKLSIILRVKPYYSIISYKGLSNIYALCSLAEKDKIEGCFVECGAYRGGCGAVMAQVVRKFKSKRKIWLFDSFKGNPEPTQNDGYRAIADAGNRSSGELECVNICMATPKEVVRLFYSLKLFSDNIIIKEGWFQDSLPKFKNEIGKIAILRLDCDWYESTKCCLENLFQNVTPGGFVIIDDYGFWEGCKKATDEFLVKANISPARLKRVDMNGCHYFQKPYAKG